MKNLLIWPILFLFLIAGCKDKEDVKPDTTFELVKGEWIRKVVTNNYYNESGTLEYNFDEVGIINFTITDGKITTLYKAAGNQVLNYTYNTSEIRDKKYLTLVSDFSDTNGNKIFTYELVSVTDQKMVWRQEKTDVVYFIGTDWHKAAKHVQTVEFVKE